MSFPASSPRLARVPVRILLLLYCFIVEGDSRWELHFIACLDKGFLHVLAVIVSSVGWCAPHTQEEVGKKDSQQTPPTHPPTMFEVVAFDFSCTGSGCTAAEYWSSRSLLWTQERPPATSSKQERVILILGCDTPLKSKKLLWTYVRDFPLVVVQQKVAEHLLT